MTVTIPTMLHTPAKRSTWGRMWIPNTLSTQVNKAKATITRKMIQFSGANDSFQNATTLQGQVVIARRGAHPKRKFVQKAHPAGRRVIQPAHAIQPVKNESPFFIRCGAMISRGQTLRLGCMVTHMTSRTALQPLGKRDKSPPYGQNEPHPGGLTWRDQ